MPDEEKILGKGSDISFDGKQWRLAPFTYDIQCEYSSWLKRRAILAVKEQLASGIIDKSEYDEKMDRVDRNITAGVYSFGGKVSVESASSQEGLKELVRLCLKRNHPEVDEKFVDRLFEEKMDEVARALRRDNSDPLSRTPPGKKTPAARSHSRMSAKSLSTNHFGSAQNRSES
jgi:hypothetical protein